MSVRREFHAVLILILGSLPVHAQDQARGTHQVEHGRFDRTVPTEARPVGNSRTARPLSLRDQAELLYRDYKATYQRVAAKLADWEHLRNQLDDSGKPYPAVDSDHPSLDFDQLTRGLKVARRLLADPLAESEFLTPQSIEGLHDLLGNPDKSTGLVSMQIALAALHEIERSVDFADKLNAYTYDHPGVSAPEAAEQAALSMKQLYGEDLFEGTDTDVAEAAAAGWIQTVQKLREAYETPLEKRDARHAR